MSRSRLKTLCAVYIVIWGFPFIEHLWFSGKIGHCHLIFRRPCLAPGSIPGECIFVSLSLNLFCSCLFCRACNLRTSRRHRVCADAMITAPLEAPFLFFFEGEREVSRSAAHCCWRLPACLSVQDSLNALLDLAGCEAAANTSLSL